MTQPSAERVQALQAALPPIAFTYVFFFLGRGVLSPFTPLWLEARGLSGIGLAIALAAPSLARLALAPAIIAGIDLFRFQRSGIIALALVCAGALALMTVASSPWSLGLCWFVVASTSAAIQPLADVVALASTKGRIWTYGRVRALGSAAYAVANLAGGGLVRMMGPFAAIAWSFWTCVATAAAARALPAAPRPAPRAEAGRVVLTRAFWRVAGPLGLIQGAHAFFYGYATLIWRDQGFDGLRIGVLWSTAVVSEILFLAMAETVRRRIGDWDLLRLSALCGVARWLLAGALPDFGWQLLAQSLHGLSFSAAFVAALRLLEQTTPPEAIRKAQSVCAGFASGFCVGALTLLGGALRSELGAGGYTAMAVIAALAFPALHQRPRAR